MKQLGFGFGQLLSAPPKWAIALGAILYIVLYVWENIVQGSPTMPDIKKLQTINILSNVQVGVLALLSLTGVKPQKNEE